MHDLNVFILKTEARQAREIARRVAKTNMPPSVSPIGSWLARLARALRQFVDPRGYARVQAHSRLSAASPGEASPPVSPLGWAPGSGEWPDTFAYSPAGMATGHRTKEDHPVVAPIATALESAPVRVDSIRAEGRSRQVASGGEMPIEIREPEQPERIPA